MTMAMGRGSLRLSSLLCQAPEMSADGHKNSQLTLARHHQPVVTRVSDAGVRVGRDDDAGSNIGSGIDVVVGQEGIPLRSTSSPNTTTS